MDTGQLMFRVSKNSKCKHVYIPPYENAIKTASFLAFINGILFTIFYSMNGGFLWTTVQVLDADPHLSFRHGYLRPSSASCMRTETGQVFFVDIDDGKTKVAVIFFFLAQNWLFFPPSNLVH